MFLKLFIYTQKNRIKFKILKNYYICIYVKDDGLNDGLNEINDSLRINKNLIPRLKLLKHI